MTCWASRIRHIELLNIQADARRRGDGPRDRNMVARSELARRIEDASFHF
jgi:hypothetical protein